MGKIFLDMAMSFDGFVAGPNNEDRGLHDWYFAPSGHAPGVIDALLQTIGAMILGRRAYADQPDGFDTPYKAALRSYPYGPAKRGERGSDPPPVPRRQVTGVSQNREQCRLGCYYQFRERQQKPFIGRESKACHCTGITCIIIMNLMMRWGSHAPAAPPIQCKE